MQDHAQIRQATASDMPAVHDLCWKYRALLVARNHSRPEIVENYYNSDTYTDLLQRLPSIHARPDGAIFIATLGGKTVGCAMSHRIDQTTCEIKRVYVDDAARGHGLGVSLFQTAMDQARRDGYARMVLDTMIPLTEAIALYRKIGFRRSEPFYDLDPDYADHIEFYEIDL